MAVLTKGLTNLRNQINERFPHRDKKSDGWIGDPAHQARTSGHNPDDTAGSEPAWDGDSDSTAEVRAYDQDKDLGEAGVTAQMEVDHIRRLPGVAGVIRYIIYNRKLYHSRNDFAPTTYTGDNPHTEHVHFEGAWSQVGDNNDDFDFQLDKLGDDMALSDDDIKKLVKAVWGFDPGNDETGEANGGVPNPDWDPKAPNPNATLAPPYALGRAVVGAKVAYQVRDRVDSLTVMVGKVLTNVTGDDSELQAIEAAIAEAREDTVRDVLLGLGAGMSIGQAAEMIRAVFGEQAPAIAEQVLNPAA